MIGLYTFVRIGLGVCLAHLKHTKVVTYNWQYLGGQSKTTIKSPTRVVNGGKKGGIEYNLTI